MLGKERTCAFIRGPFSCRSQSRRRPAARCVCTQQGDAHTQPNAPGTRINLLAAVAKSQKQEVLITLHFGGRGNNLCWIFQLLDDCVNNLACFSPCCCRCCCGGYGTRRPC